MKRALFFTISLTATTLLFAQTPVKQLDSLLNVYYKANEPGAAVAIIQNGKPLYQKNIGVTDLSHPSPITSFTNFNIASLTKQFTAAAILQLVEKNKLSLSDPVTKFFPPLNHVLTNRVSVWHLLTHSSGIQDHYSFVDTRHMKHAGDHDVLKAVEKTTELYFAPGSNYRYSNTAYCLLALIIEKVSGLSYADYIQKNIFSPLHMNHSAVLDTLQAATRASTGYQLDSMQHFIRSDADENIFFSTQGDGGIYTSVTEYIKWFTALQKGTILSPASIKQARSIQQLIDSNNKLGYGFGWFIGAKEQPEVVYHTGSNGGFRSIVVTIPAANYALIIFSNRTGVDLEMLAKEINKILRVTNKSLQPLESLISFQYCWPIFAPCKKTPRFLTSFQRNSTASVMALN